MSTLGSKTLRLASSLPEGEFREKVLAAVKEAAGLSWNNTVAGEKARIRWTTGSVRGAILIEELPSRGKKRLRRARYSTGDTFGNLADMPNAFLIDNLMRDMKPSPSMSYEQAVGALKEALAEAIAYVDAGKEHRRKELHQWERSQLARLPYEEDVFYLEVEPSDYSPLTIQGKDFVMKAEWGEFEAFSPNSDMHQADPHYSVLEQKSAGAARKLYKILKADPDALRNVGWHGLSDWLSRNGIGFEMHHSQWR